MSYHPSLLILQRTERLGKHTTEQPLMYKIFNIKSIRNLVALG
jgi:hypothetical protein